MPIYEYKCDRCEHQLEILQKISDEPAKTCPECGVESLRKLVSAAAFKLKGTGWYETDFKDKKPKQETNSGAGKKSSSDSDANKSDSKVAANKSKESSKASASGSASK